MSPRGYHRARPKISFALATLALFLGAAILTGVLRVEVDTAPLETNPSFVVAVLIFAFISTLLLYEW